MFPFYKKKKFISDEQSREVIEAIRKCEQRTSGEIRVFVESRNKYVDPLERATELFVGLKMNLTEHRNAVLLYIATKDKEVALFGDQGIHEQVGTEFWNNEVTAMLKHFREGNLAEGIIRCVRDVGEVLCNKFPYHPGDDRNELPDDIVFGK